MHCTNDGNELTKLPSDSSWASRYYCSKCTTRFEFVFPDRMSGYHRQYDVSVFDIGFEFKEEKQTNKSDSNIIDLRD